MASAWERGLLSGAAMTLELTGLLLQGVREGFDGQGLEEATPDGQELINAPSCTIAWIPKADAMPYSASESIDVPLYNSTQRERMLLTLSLPCERGAQSKWISAGVAAFCSGEMN